MEELVNLADALSEQHRCGQYLSSIYRTGVPFPSNYLSRLPRKWPKLAISLQGGKKKLKYCILLEEVVAFGESNISRFCPFLMGGLSSGIILIEGHSTKYMTSALLLTVKVVKTKKNLSLLNSKKIKPVKSKGNQP